MLTELVGSELQAALSWADFQICKFSCGPEALAPLKWDFPQIQVPYFGVLIIKIPTI